MIHIGKYSLWHIGINVIYLCTVVSSELVNQLSVSFVCYKIFFTAFCSEFPCIRSILKSPSSTVGIVGSINTEL